MLLKKPNRQKKARMRRENLVINNYYSPFHKNAAAAAFAIFRHGCARKRGRAEPMPRWVDG